MCKSEDVNCKYTACIPIVMHTKLPCISLDPAAFKEEKMEKKKENEDARAHARARTHQKKSEGKEHKKIVNLLLRCMLHSHSGKANHLCNMSHFRR